MHFVTNAEYLGDYKIKVTFETGEEKTTNLERYIGSGFVFGPLENKDIFKSFFIENDTINWETGADFSPDFLYEIGTKK